MARLFTALLAAFSMFASAIAVEASGADSPGQEAYAPAALRADFEGLYRRLQSAHFDLFVHRPKSEYDALYAKMLAELGQPLTPFEAKVRFQTFLAYGNVAHARIEFPGKDYQEFRAQGGRALPIYLRIADGRAYVGENYSGDDSIHLGDEILAINGDPASAWLARTARHISADTPYIAHSLLEFMFPAYLWLEIGEVESFDVTLKRRGKRARKVKLPAITAEELEAAAKNGPKLFSLDTGAREARMLDASTAYLRPGPFYNAENSEAMWDVANFGAFIDSAFEDFIARGATTLIIDLRENPGGDNSFSDPMIAWFADRPFRFASAFHVKSSPEAAASNQARLDQYPAAGDGPSGVFARKYAATPYGDVFDFDIPEAHPREGRRFEGDVFILVNRHSYSNAVNVAAIVQDYGFGRIIGEKTSDMATTYGAMETFRLPNTGIEVGFPKAHIIRPSGEPKSDGVTPDVAIETPIAPTADDVVLEEARRVAAAGR